MNRYRFGQHNNNLLVEEGWVLFLQLQEPTAMAGDLERFEEWKSRSPAHAEAAFEIEELWISMDALQDRPWPTTDELRRDRGEDLGAFVRRPAVWASAMTAVAAVVVVTLYSVLDLNQTEIYSTGRDEHRLVNLADGSELILGAMSEVSVKYSSAQRSVQQLRGEVLFTVAEDKERPFIVDTQGASVRAVGTAFNIDTSTVLTVISVVKGVVQVDLGGSPAVDPSRESKGARRKLVANEELAFHGSRIIKDTHRADMDDVLAWRSGRFVFSGAPLAQVVDEINRYSETPLKVGDKAAGELLFTGFIQKTQFESWMRALEASFPVRVSREGASFVIYSIEDSSSAPQLDPGSI